MKIGRRGGGQYKTPKNEILVTSSSLLNQKRERWENRNINAVKLLIFNITADSFYETKNLLYV